MTSNIGTGLPGMDDPRQVSKSRPVCLDDYGVVADGFVTIDASLTRDYGNTSNVSTVRDGTCLIQKPADGLFVPAILGQLGTAYTTGTTLTVGVATAQAIAKSGVTSGNLYIIGGVSSGTTAATAITDINTEAIAFSAVDTTAGTLTITALALDYAVGAVLVNFRPGYAPNTNADNDSTNGHAHYFVFSGDAHGTRVVNDDAEEVDTPVRVAYEAGRMNTARIPFWPANRFVAAVLGRNIGLNQKFQFTQSSIRV